MIKKIVKAGAVALLCAVLLIVCIIGLVAANAFITLILPQPWGVIAAVLFTLFFGYAAGEGKAALREEEEARRLREQRKCEFASRHDGVAESGNMEGDLSPTSRRRLRLNVLTKRRLKQKPIVYVLTREDWLRLIYGERNNVTVYKRPGVSPTLK